MFVNKPMIDYIRVSGFSAELAESLTRRYSDQGIQSHAKMMDYRGQSFAMGNGSFAVMSRKRNGHESWLLSWSGEFAHDEFHIVPKGWQGTRVDVQTTIPQVRSEEVLEAYNHARHYPVWYKGGVISAPKLIRSDTDTFYNGSRRSARLMRIYTKHDDEGKPYTRLEWELKLDRAKWAKSELHRYDNADIGANVVFCSLMKDITSKFWLYGLFDCVPEGLAEPFKVESRDRDTMSWLETTQRSWGRVLGMHDTRARAHALLARLVDLAREYPV